jgi:hypothetical protein
MNLTELTALVRAYCLYRSVEISKGRFDMKKNKPLFYEMRVLSILVAALLMGCSTYQYRNVLVLFLIFKEH